MYSHRLCRDFLGRWLAHPSSRAAQDGFVANAKDADHVAIVGAEDEHARGESQPSAANRRPRNLGGSEDFSEYFAQSIVCGIGFAIHDIESLCERLAPLCDEQS